jgi:hypothetical protein
MLLIGHILITRTTSETAKMKETFSWYHKWLQ